MFAGDFFFSLSILLFLLSSYLRQRSKVCIMNGIHVVGLKVVNVTAETRGGFFCAWNYDIILY